MCQIAVNIPRWVIGGIEKTIKSKESRHPCLGLDFSGIFLSFSPFKLISAIGFAVNYLILKYGPCILDHCMTCIMKWG